MTPEMSTKAPRSGKLILAEMAVTYKTIRRHTYDFRSEPVDNVEKARELLGRLFDRKPVEALYAVAFNSCGDLLGLLRLSEGTVDRASVYPRELVSFLLIETNATAVIIAHNHPGGRKDASVEDVQLTRRLEEILRPLGVKVLDHFICACGRPGIPQEWTSLRTSGAI